MLNENIKQLRKAKGLSQEELAAKLGVVRQTISKWEVGDSTPEMEKLIAISDLFGISLDELVMDKAPVKTEEVSAKSELISELTEKVLTDDNKKKAKKGLKIAAYIVGALLLIDAISMIVYFSLYGFPQ